MLKVWPGLSLLLISECERRGERKRKLVSKREPELEDLKNSQTIQIVQSENRAKGLARQGSAKEQD